MSGKAISSSTRDCFVALVSIWRTSAAYSTIGSSQHLHRTAFPGTVRLKPYQGRCGAVQV